MGVGPWLKKLFRIATKAGICCNWDDWDANVVPLGCGIPMEDPIGMQHPNEIIPRSLAIGMKSSQWMEVGCLIGVRLWMNQLG